MGLNTPMDVGQNDAYPGSQQLSSQYATPNQSPMNALNTGYEPRTDAYGDQMMAGGGIAALRFDDGGDVQKTESTWTPDQPVKLQTMTQMLGSEEDRAGGKSFNPTEHGYKWDTEYGKFMNPNGSTLSVNLDGSVSSATPAYKDYEFNGKYWNPAGENVTWNPDTSTSAYKIGGVEVPIGREHMKGIAALTDASGTPKMQIDEAGQAIFTEPEGLRYTGNFMADTGAPMIGAALLGGTAALAGGAFGSAGTTMAGEAAAATMAGEAGAGAYPGISSADLGTTLTNVPSSTVPYSNIGVSSADLGTTATNAINVSPNGIASLEAIPTNTLTNADLAKLAQMGDIGGSPGYKLAADTAGMNMYQKAALGSLALKGLTSGSGGYSGSGGGTQYATQSSAPTTTTTTSTPTRAPTAQAPVFSFPTYNSNQNTGTAYNPYLFNYQTRNAAQGGLMYADGGIADLGGYAAGGKLLRGPGDGMSDSIEANIGGKQPARLADGEFVVPADVVSHLGNGSTDAGAKHLYKMMDNIRKARTGNPKQGKKINADKFLPRN
jgi:hypothetical protein